MKTAELILINGRITTLDKENPEAAAAAIANGQFIAVGSEKAVMHHFGTNTRVVDLKNKRVVPGINDSHTHLIRGGLNYNLELRWDGVPSLADAMRMLQEQVARTPTPQWVRVVGGWSEFQFAERRMPTLDEINKLSPDTPVFILHLYDRALLNRAALRAIGYNRASQNPPGGMIEKDAHGEPTGLIIASPNARILYAALGQGPKLSYEYQMNSTRHYMREMNRFGITSVIDAGGGGQSYPDDYTIIEELHKNGQLTVRIAYNLFTQTPSNEFEDFRTWIDVLKLSRGDRMYRPNGAGEMLVYSGADFEDFLQPRPDLPEIMEEELERVVRLLVENRWPFRLHATYNESISRFLNVFEKVNREVPFNGLRWIFDHAETISEKNMERVKALGGGIAIQDRMAFQGEYFADRYGHEAASGTPPVKKMLEMGIPVGGGTDATRVTSYNPWVALYWLVSGKTVGGTELYRENKIDRLTALELYTHGSAWFSNEQDVKGVIKPGQLADLAVLNKDFFTVDDEAIKFIEAEMTIVDGRVVYGRDDFASLAPPEIVILPDWSPNNIYNGYYPGANNLNIAPVKTAHAVTSLASQVHHCAGSCNVHTHDHNAARFSKIPLTDFQNFWGALGCSCFAF